MNRRGFLGAMLAAAVAPAIVRASSLMPIAPPKVWVPSSLAEWHSQLLDELRYAALMGEIGSWEGIRLIESRTLPRNAGDTIRFRRFEPYFQAGAGGILTATTVIEAAARFELQNSVQLAESCLAIVHPSWAEDLRAAGIPVKREG